MDVHPPKHGINRYWSIPIYIYISMVQTSLQPKLDEIGLSGWQFFFLFEEGILLLVCPINWMVSYHRKSIWTILRTNENWPEKLLIWPTAMVIYMVILATQIRISPTNMRFKVERDKELKCRTQWFKDSLVVLMMFSRVHMPTFKRINYHFVVVKTS